MTRIGTGVTAFVLACMLLTAASAGMTQNPAAPAVAPKNPAFAKYFQQVSAAASLTTSQEGHSYGLVPVPIDLSHASKKRAPRARTTTQPLPASFDLRVASPAKLPPVRNQGSCGSCWAFGSYASLESCLLPGETIDFSENHAKNTHGFDWGCCDGGNHYMTAAYVARWSGPVLEADEPYNASSCTSPQGLQAVRHIQDIDFIPDRADSLDNDTIKRAVMDHGAVYTTLYMTESATYYNSATRALYYTGTSGANHAVCIVGWDDNYSSGNFATAPPGDGAFIIRNSWGSGWGEAGYFYVSYHDIKVGHENAVFPAAEPTSNFDQVYDYDPLGWVSSVGYGGNAAWFANVFTATSDGEVAAASFYTASPGSTYELRIYVNPDSPPVSTAGYAAARTGNITEMGYHTVRLDSPVPVESGDRFSVVVKLTTPGYDYPIPFEEPYSGYSTAASANPGESYISADGASWEDITTSYAGANVCLKAFAVNAEGLSVSPGAALASQGPAGGPFSPASREYTISNTSTETINWEASADQPWIHLSASAGSLNSGAKVTVAASIGPDAAALPPGTHTGTITFTNLSTGVGTGSREVSLSVLEIYETRPSQFRWIAPDTHALLTLEDDGVSGPQAIPFELSYYGKSYSQLYVSANGMIGFADDHLGAYENADIPDAAVPNAIICPYWDDLNPSGGGSVRIGVEGSAPSRKLVVSWVDVPLFAAPSVALTFQAVLCEGSRDIICQYLDVRPDAAGFGAGRGATVGIESDAGATGARYSYNGSIPLVNRTALLFTSRGPEVSAIKGYAADTTVSIRRAIVTAAWGDVFYVESDDRTSGIRVEKQAHGLGRWIRADVAGPVRTNADGERCIQATCVSESGVGSVSPVGLNLLGLGGASALFDQASGSGQQGTQLWRYGIDPTAPAEWRLTDSTGPNNIGLLVVASGRVTWAGADCFYLHDGSNVKDNSPHLGVRVCAPGIALPSEGSFVRVTGVSSCFTADGAIYPTLLVHGADDIIVLQP